MVAPRQLERLFDLRTFRRNIRSGLITKDRYEEWLKTLPDAADNVATMSYDDEDRERRRPIGGAVISPTRPLASAPFDDDEDDDDDEDMDDEDEDDEDEDEDDDEDEAEGDKGGDAEA